MEKKRLGLALCGSYCTYEKLFENASVLTADYAAKIGADSYSKDAMGLVREAERICAIPS